MENDESIKDMLSRFNNIINGLKSLGFPNKNVEYKWFKDINGL